MSKLYTFILFIAFSSAPLALSAGEAEQQTALELLGVMQFEKVINDSTNASVEMLKKMNPEAVANEAAVRNFFKKCMDIEILKNETVAIYSDTFTVNELQDMIVFYKTSTGQKALQKLPEIMQRSMQSAQARVMGHIGELEAILTANKPVTPSEPAIAAEAAVTPSQPAIAAQPTVTPSESAIAAQQITPSEPAIAAQPTVIPSQPARKCCRSGCCS